MKKKDSAASIRQPEIFSLDHLRQRWSRAEKTETFPLPVNKAALAERQAEGPSAREFFASLQDMMVAQKADFGPHYPLLASHLAEIDALFAMAENPADLPAAEQARLDLREQLALLEDLLEALLLAKL